MTYVLIIWIIIGNAGGITTHEFPDKESCENAGKLSYKAGSWNTGVYYVCAPKNLEMSK